MGLEWVRLQTGFPDNPKTLALVDRRKFKALFVYTCSIAWSGRQETHGFIPRSALPFIHGDAKDAQELVAERLWIPSKTGWDIHGYAEYQITNVTQAQRHNAAVIAACKRWHSQPCSECSPVDLEAI